MKMIGKFRIVLHMHLRHHENHFKFNKTILKNYFLFSCSNNLGEQVLVNLE